MQVEVIFAFGATVFALLCLIAVHRAASSRQQRFMFDLLDMTFGRKAPPPFPREAVRRVVARRLSQAKTDRTLKIARKQEPAQVRGASVKSDRTPELVPVED